MIKTHKVRARVKNVSTNSKENNQYGPIDYEKLADAIVKANRKSEIEENRHSRFRNKVINFLNGVLYMAGCALCIFRIYFTFKSDVSLAEKIIMIFIYAVIIVALFLCQQESLDESPKESREHLGLNVGIFSLLIAIYTFYIERN